MAINNTSKIITDGLVFAYDSANRKSYQGPPITNLISGISLAGTGTGTAYVSTGITEVVNIPQLGPTVVYTNTIQNNYPTSGNCCPSLFQYGGWNVSGSTLYTYAIVYRVDSGYTGPNYMYRYEYNGGTYVTELGVHDTAKRIYLGDGWWWAWNTTTTQPTTTRINSSGLWYYQYSTVPDKISVAKVLFAQGDWSSLHPKYWPESNTTRSNTQAIVDLVGNNTVTANSLTYNSDGTISLLNNSGFSIPTINFADAQTIEMWLKPLEADGNRRNPYNQGYGGYGTWTHEPDGSINYYYGDAGGDGSPYIGHTSSFTVAQNEIACVCTTRDLNTSWWYKNGVQYNSYSHSFGSLTATPGNITIGNGYAGAYYGNIYAVKLYNRALTAAEVSQNFNALRGRYGI